MRTILRNALVAAAFLASAAASYAGPATISGGGGSGGAVTPASPPSSYVIGVHDYTVDHPDTITKGATDQANEANDWLLDVQYARLLKVTPAGTDSVKSRAWEMARIAPIRLSASSSLVIPNGVLLESDAYIKCGTASGSASATWDGVATNALANVERPCIIRAVGAGINNVAAVGLASHLTSGMVSGQTWVPSSVAVAQNGGQNVCGTGYTGDGAHYVQIAQPSPAPFAIARVIVDSYTNTHTCTIHLDTSNRGSYELPSGLQLYQWTRPLFANAGSTANGAVGKVFDASVSGAYLTTGGTETGTGLEVTITWKPDFASDGSVYFAGARLIDQGFSRDVSMTNLATTTDATYGPSFGYMNNDINDTANNIYVGGGYHGFYLQGSGDLVLGSLRNVGAGHTCAKLTQSNAADPTNTNAFNVSIGILDCDTAHVDDLEADRVNDLNIGTAYSIFNTGSDNCNSRVAPIELGQDSGVASSTHVVRNIQIGQWNLIGAGATGGVAAIAGDFTAGGHIKLHIGNVLGDNSSATCTITSVLSVSGTHWTNMKVEGEGDGLNSTLISGTPGSGASFDFHNDAQGWRDLGNGNRLYDSGGLAYNRTSDPGQGNTDASGCYKAAGTCINNTGTATVPLANLPTQSGNTLLGNSGSGSAVPAAISVSSCSKTGQGLIWTSNTGPGCNSIGVLGHSGATVSVPDTNGTLDTLVTISVPANTLGSNGCISVNSSWTFTGNTDTKTIDYQFNGTNMFSSSTATNTNVEASFPAMFCNANATNAQIGLTASNGTIGFSTSSIPTAAADTTGAINLTIKASQSGSDSMALKGYQVQLWPN